MLRASLFLLLSGLCSLLIWTAHEPKITLPERIPLSGTRHGIVKSVYGCEKGKRTLTHLSAKHSFIDQDLVEHFETAHLITPKAQGIGRFVTMGYENGSPKIEARNFTAEVSHAP